MRLETKSEKALLALMDLAKHSNGSPVTLAAISSRTKISIAYLEQLFRNMRLAGLVRSVRGPGGGYVLDKPPELIVLSEIVDAVDPMSVSAKTFAFKSAARIAYDFLATCTLKWAIERVQLECTKPNAAAQVTVEIGEPA